MMMVKSHPSAKMSQETMMFTLMKFLARTKTRMMMMIEY
jgi:hypothetical protein